MAASGPDPARPSRRNPPPPVDLAAIQPAASLRALYATYDPKTLTEPPEKNWHQILAGTIDGITAAHAALVADHPDALSMAASTLVHGSFFHTHDADLATFAADKQLHFSGHR